MTLAELIAAVPELRLVLLNADADLDRPVVGIDSTETPDIAAYLAPHTLLTTTAMVYQDDQAGLISLISQLHEAECAGLAIKLGRFIFALDSEVIEAANLLRFPLFSIPSDMTLGIVYHKLQSHIWGVQTTQLYETLDIQRQMSALLFRGASRAEILQHFAQLIKRDVLYCDFFFDSMGIGAAANGIPHIHRRVADEVRGALQGIHRQQPILTTDEFTVQTSEGAIHVIVTPVESKQSYPAFLVILYAQWVPDSFAYLTAEQAGSMLSLLAHTDAEGREARWHSLEGHLLNLLRLDAGTAPPIADLRAFPAAFSFDDLGSCQVVCIGVDHSALSEGLAGLVGRDHLALVESWVSKQLRALRRSPGQSVLVPLRSQNLLFALIREPRTNIQPLLQSMAEGLAQYVPLRLCFGIGNQAHGIESLNASYIEASSALRKALGDASLPALQVYSSEGISELLQFAPDDHIRHYCEHVLHALAYPESEYHRYLRETLEAYLDCQRDITHTAKTLFVHRNTVRYRINKIGLLLDGSLNDPTFTLQLRLAIHLSRAGAV